MKTHLTLAVNRDYTIGVLVIEMFEKIKCEHELFLIHREKNHYRVFAVSNSI